MKYKFSKYNVQFTRNGDNYLWNTLTGALIKLDTDGISYLNDNTCDDTHPFFACLLKSGCIIDERYNELGKILIDEKAAMLNPVPQSIHFTIAPGLGCNYSCPYCFEKNRLSHSTMSKEVQNEVCKYIVNIANNNPYLEYIGITWFGGEPLLYSEAINYISERIIKYCDKRKIKYGAGIVTNGRFLDKKMAEQLVNNRVSYVQLAMDGMGDYYATQKGTSKFDFDATVQNIIESADTIPITVRINISDSLEEAKKLTEYLLKTKNLDGRIKIYVAHIRDYSEKCMAIEEKAHSDFLKLEKEYMSYFQNGKRYSRNSLFYVQPARRATTCLSVCGNNFCVGPEGELYRCEHFFGDPKYIVGTVKNGRFYTDVEVDYVTHKHPDKCVECEMFPVCLGGCMNDNKGGDVALSCERFKERLIDYLVY